ncbi:hypothetical protein Hanom_Chr12g01170631 [Helianthus anomalus]
MDESILDADQIKNLIKFCPTKEEMDLLKWLCIATVLNYTGDKKMLGQCEHVGDQIMDYYIFLRYFACHLSLVPCSFSNKLSLSSFFLELMKVPRVESKLCVFFCSKFNSIPR